MSSGPNFVVAPHTFRAWVLWKGVYYLNDTVSANLAQELTGFHTIIPFTDPSWRQVRVEDVPPEVKLQLRLEEAI